MSAGHSTDLPSIDYPLGDVMVELSGLLAQWDSYERVARVNGWPERTWRVHYRPIGAAGGSSIWTDARTVRGALQSIHRQRRAHCLIPVEVVAVEEDR